jgi:putative oxidoreductase
MNLFRLERKLYPATWESFTLLMLRFALGGIALYYGLAKVVAFDTTIQLFNMISIPGWMGVAAGLTEIVCALMLLIGMGTRFFSFLLAMILIVAIVAVQIHRGMDPRFERDISMLASLLVLTWTGPGKYSVSWLLNREKDRRL